MGVYGLPLTLPISTERTAESRMFAIPRPLTRRDCMQEARPCPWAGCRHHLLLELSDAMPRANGDAPRPTALRMNGLPHGPIRTGRRPGLRSSAAAALVRTWIDDAVERLSGRLEFTCTFDVVDAYPQGVPPAKMAEILGESEQLIDVEVRAAKERLRIGLAKDDDAP